MIHILTVTLYNADRSVKLGAGSMVRFENGACHVLIGMWDAYGHLTGLVNRQALQLTRKQREWLVPLAEKDGAEPPEKG